MTFSGDITKFVKKTGLAADLVLRKLTLDGYRNLLLLSPVDTGRFRGNWRVGVNLADLRTIAKAPGRSKSTLVGSPVTRGESLFARSALLVAKFGSTIHITNNLPYAVPLERGHSKQSRAMLRRTFVAMKRNVRKITRQARKEAKLK